MLQTRRVAVHLAQRPLLYQRRRYADTKSTKPPDPISLARGVDDQPATNPMSEGDSSGTPSPEAASAGGHGPPQHSHHPEPVDENLGRGFYVSIAALALSFALYKFSRSSSSDPSDAGNPDKQPLITRMLAYYNWWQEEFARRNTMHTEMVEQAASDRNLFQSSSWSHHVDLKFPEIFNTGSPYNVPAGHSINLDQVIAHYEKQNVEAEQKRLERLKRQEGDSEVLRQREAALSVEGKPKSTLQLLGLSKPDS